VHLFQKIIECFRPPKAMVFVDYEYWYYSYRNLFGLQPNLAEWVTELRTQYDIADVRVFADFTSPGLYGEKKKLSAVTEAIFDTEGESSYRKKDMTDFVMLDSIYQCADYERNIGTYILFTGDGHFHSVVKYLVGKKHKNVIIYGVLDSISKRLQETATDYITMPLSAERIAVYRRMIIENLAYVVDKVNIIPTFKGTIDAVVRKYGVNADEVHKVLSDMIDQGYVVRKDYYVEFKKSVKIVAADWDKLIADGYWSPEEQSATQRI